MFRGGSLEVRFKEKTKSDESSNDYELIAVDYASSRENTGLKVFINNKAVDCEITEIDFVPIHYS